jgi:hypothetical protein
MTPTPSAGTNGSPDLPYGASRGRSRAPVIILSVLYAAWFLFLLWMAIFLQGRR